MNRDFDYARHLAKSAARTSDTERPGFRYQALDRAAKLLYWRAMHPHQRKAWELWSHPPDKRDVRIAELESQLVSLRGGPAAHEKDRVLMLPPPPMATHNVEILRVWLCDEETAERELRMMLNAGAFTDPTHVNGAAVIWGMALADVARHLASALADTLGVDEGLALANITKTFTSEIGSPTTESKTSRVSTQLSSPLPFDEASLPKIPPAPGVYILIGTRGIVNFVGKSDTDLRARVRGILRTGNVPASRFQYAVVEDPEVRETMRRSLILQHAPRYNAD